MKAAQQRVAPKDAQAVSKLVARCDRTGEKIRIAGGETLAGMGFPPERLDVTLETTSLTGIVANECADLVIAARAGTPLADIATLLARQGQFVPFDAPQPQYATLGGTLAAGWLGPRRHLYGRVRDYLIGSTIVLADGTIARAGGMVVKNVAGYDMSRLYVGSFGTLGVLVQANLKTIPAPPHARLFLAPLPERTRERACSHLAALGIRCVSRLLDRRLSTTPSTATKVPKDGFSSCSRAARRCSNARRSSCARRSAARACRRRASSMPGLGRHSSASSMRTLRAWASDR